MQKNSGCLSRSRIRSSIWSKSISKIKKNLASDTIKSFGDEWCRFDQSQLPDAEARKIFDEYFSIFPWQALPADATGFDMGCGSGRWAKLVAPRIGHLHCIDPSSALAVAKQNLALMANVSFHPASAVDRPLREGSQDFGYSLGVLQHVPDTVRAIRDCVAMLKPGAPLLIYLYYAFENRSAAYRLLWRLSDLLRRVICRLPSNWKLLVTDAIAVLVYFPMARVGLLAERAGLSVSSWPLSHYRHHSFYTMRTDSRDRFGTPLEQRFTRQEISDMLYAAGLRDVCFSNKVPFWCAVGIKQ